MSAIRDHESETLSFAEIVASNIRAIAGLRGFNQAHIADNTSLSRSAVHHRWNGNRQWQLEDLEEVAAVLRVEPWELCIPLTNESGGPVGTAAVNGTPPGTRTLNPLINGLATVLDFDDFVDRRAA